ncbi:hypothetical protein Ga0123462_0843 [Mariprofundus ferrinatatus]|uniref:Uncharacterized protein n=1 Tax=Mariprofundus ferrinatatus TaxID=1921087 RepID=A0A2K8L3N3_9PROT|nr:hypothetical protein Ga0123462_0843 [Mariprofundus ferrinatatus]
MSSIMDKVRLGVSSKQVAIQFLVCREIPFDDPNRSIMVDFNSSAFYSSP